MGRKVIYVGGPITGVPNYWEAFEQADDTLTGMGYTVLTPSRLPQGMSDAQYMRICLAMIDCADAVVFLHEHTASRGCEVERKYCEYTGKRWLTYPRSLTTPGSLRAAQDLAQLRERLEEVLSYAGH